MWHELVAYEPLIQQARNLTLPATAAKEIINFIDFTRLKSNDEPSAIQDFCVKANNNLVPVVCIYPEFIRLAKEYLLPTIKVACVCNFPEGCDSKENILKQIDFAISQGADEIDLVLPYLPTFSQHQKQSLEIINTCKQGLSNKKLKVILESELWPDLHGLYEISMAVIKAGADFIKTSTGKKPIGGTLEAATAMFLAIKQSQSLGYDIGFKASGGIRNVRQAYTFLFLARHIMGDDWPNHDHFRIGTSSSEILTILS